MVRSGSHGFAAVRTGSQYKKYVAFYTTVKKCQKMSKTVKQCQNIYFRNQNEYLLFDQNYILSHVCSPSIHIHPSHTHNSNNNTSQEPTKHSSCRGVTGKKKNDAFAFLLVPIVCVVFFVLRSNHHETRCARVSIHISSTAVPWTFGGQQYPLVVDKKIGIAVVTSTRVQEEYNIKRIRHEDTTKDYWSV